VAARTLIDCVVLRSVNTMLYELALITSISLIKI